MIKVDFRLLLRCQRLILGIFTLFYWIRKLWLHYLIDIFYIFAFIFAMCDVCTLDWVQLYFLYLHEYLYKIITNIFWYKLLFIHEYLYKIGHSNICTQQTLKRTLPQPKTLENGQFSVYCGNMTDHFVKQLQLLRLKLEKYKYKLALQQTLLKCKFMFIFFNFNRKSCSWFTKWITSKNGPKCYV